MSSDNPAHVIDDLLQQRDAMGQQIQKALALLEVLPHAVENGATSVVTEYIDRVTTHLETARATWRAD